MLVMPEQPIIMVEHWQVVGWTIGDCGNGNSTGRRIEDEERFCQKVSHTSQRYRQSRLGETIHELATSIISSSLF